MKHFDFNFKFKFEGLNNFNLGLLSNFKELYFIFPYMLSRGITMLINLWTFAYIINNYLFYFFLFPENICIKT